MEKLILPKNKETRAKWLKVIKAMNDPKINVIILEGGVRAGKNVLVAMASAMAMYRSDYSFNLVLGTSAGNAWQNFVDAGGFGVLDWFEIFDVQHKKTQYKAKEAVQYLPKDTSRPSHLIAGGGKNYDSFTGFKGNTYGMIILDEANDLHPLTIEQAELRVLASKESKIVYLLNPKDPMHWFYDKIDAIIGNDDVCHVHFTTFENPLFEDEEELAALEKKLKHMDKNSIPYRRDILGERVQSGLQIYNDFNDDCIITYQDALKKTYVDVKIGIDTGYADAMVFTISGYTEGWSEKVEIAVWSHRQGINEGMDPYMYMQEFFAFINKNIDRAKIINPALAGMIRTARVGIDDADKGFRILLSNKKYSYQLGSLNIGKANKLKILERISFTQTLLAENRYKVVDECEELIRAFRTSVWDEKIKQEKGELVRLDNRITQIDPLDSSEYTLNKNIIAAMSYKNI